MLGICRRLQVINVFFGGTLIPHLDEAIGDGHSKSAPDRTQTRHAVRCEADSILFDLYGSTSMVNSFHHQAVDQPGQGLKVTAYSTDGTVEGIEDSSGLIVGVQWHPEMLESPQAVFAWLIEKANEKGSTGAV